MEEFQPLEDFHVAYVLDSASQALMGGGLWGIWSMRCDVGGLRWTSAVSFFTQSQVMFSCWSVHIGNSNDVRAMVTELQATAGFSLTCPTKCKIRITEAESTLVAYLLKIQR